MEDDGNHLEIQEFRDDFRLAVYQLMQIIENELGEGRHRIRPDISEWLVHRAKTIEKLDELRQKLDQTFVAASYGKGVGIGASVAGDVMSIIAAIMEWRESSSAQSLKNLGTSVSHTGSLIEGASNAVESFVSAKYLLEIEEVLKRDQELSRPLQEWLAFSRNMEANVRELFGCDLNFAVQNNVLKVFSEFTMLYNRSRDFQQTLDLMRQGSYSMDINSNVTIERLLRFSSQLERYPDLLGNIQTICSTLTNSARAVQVAREGVRVCRNLFGETNLNSRTVENQNIPLAGSNSAATEDSNAHENDIVAECSLRTEGDNIREPSTATQVSTYCAFQTINAAVNVVHMSTVIMSIQDGKSKYSHALQQISDLLAMELRSMEAL